MYTLGLEGGVQSQRMLFDKVRRKVDGILSEVPEYAETIALGNRERLRKSFYPCIRSDWRGRALDIVRSSIFASSFDGISDPEVLHWQRPRIE